MSVEKTDHNAWLKYPADADHIHLVWAELQLVARQAVTQS